jgi:hypothetical protein
VEIVECYVQVDADGDGVSEWRQVCIGSGGSGFGNVASEKQMLSA